MGGIVPGMGGGGGKKGGAPPPPDYKGAAEQTGVQNRPNQQTPFASNQWSIGPDGRPVQSISLDPALQGAATGLEGQFASANANPLDNGAQARQRAEDAIYNRSTSRLDPQWNTRDEQFKAQLANSGLDINSEAGSKAFQQFNNARNDAYQQAQYGAIQGGGQEASRQQQMDLMSRSAPLSQLSGLLGLTSMPGVTPGANYLAAAGMEGNYNLESQQMQNQAGSDFWSGLTDMGSAAIPFLLKNAPKAAALL